MTDRKGVSPAQQAAIAQTETWGRTTTCRCPW